jgi:hypothetical protein
MKFFTNKPTFNYEKAYPKHSCELQIYVANFKHLMFETSSHVKALTHFIIKLMLMIRLLTFPMEILSI